MSDSTQSPERQMSPAKQRQRSRYDRPRRYISWSGLILGMIFGVAGALYVAWNLLPVEEVNISPSQLREDDRNHYVVAVMLDYAYDGKLSRTVQRLIALDLPGDDPIQVVADIACDMVRTGYVDNNGGLNAIRYMQTFYQGQAKSGCADDLLPVVSIQPTSAIIAVLPSPTLRPPASKTPTPPSINRPTEIPIAREGEATQPPSQNFELVGLNTFCSTEIVGVVEVRVVDFNFQEIPGKPIRVRWVDGQSTFFTGLKPERGDGYADFNMEPGRAYTIEMPGLSDPSSSPITADECFTESGDSSVKSWRVTFQGG